MARYVTVQQTDATAAAGSTTNRAARWSVGERNPDRLAKIAVGRVLTLAFIGMALLPQPAQAAEPKEICAPVNASVRKFPHLGLAVTVEKCDATVSTVAGRLFNDGKQISAVEFAVIEQAEGAAVYAERGALDESLDVQLAECQKGMRKSLTVMAWARIQATSSYDKNSDLQSKQSTQEPWAIAASQIGLIASCASAKAQDCRLLDSVPVAFMTIDCEQVGSLAFDQNIGRIFAMGELTPATTPCSSGQGIYPGVVKNEPPFIYGSTTIRGQGTKTCVIDASNLDNLTFNPGATRMNPDAPGDLIFHHASMTVGIVQSIVGPVPGIAKDTQSYLANYVAPQNIMQSAAWCGQNGARNWAVVVGNSTSGGAAAGALQDFYYRNAPWPFITSVGGNEGAAAITDQPTTLNSLVVGYTDDNVTVARADDVMNPNSNAANPVSLHGDLETPQIVAPGTGVFSAGWSGCGSSLAAPMVAATGALVEQISPSVANWPEAKRAIILTGADENIAGTANPLTVGIDSVDGVGELNVQLALTIAKPENIRGMAGVPSQYGYGYGVMLPFANWFNGAQHGVSDGYRVTVPPGVNGANLRVVLVWDATACAGVENGGCASSTADADLDLYVCKVGTTECWFSATYDNTWEMVQKSVVAGEAYNIYIYSYIFTAPFTYFSVAWAVDTYGVAP